MLLKCEEPPTPTPPVTTRAPVEYPVDEVELDILVFPPMFNVPAIPAPPSTINAPVVVLVEANAEVT